jgi:hypothetical protein
MTLRYSHLSPDVKRDAVKLLDAPSGAGYGNLTATEAGSPRAENKNPGNPMGYRGK